MHHPVAYVGMTGRRLSIDGTTLGQKRKELLTQCLRPYHVENTGSRPITEVKQRRAWLVRGWVTASEYHLL